MAITPVAGITAVPVGGTPIDSIPAGANGGFITNPLSATDQGLGSVEVLYVNQAGPATTQGNGTTFALQPGQSWTIIPGSTLSVSVNSLSSGHKFSAVYW